MPSQTAAASSKDTFAGMVVIGARSGRHRYSACAPMWSALTPNTRSPGAKPVTSAPTASTTPANSVPSTGSAGEASR